MDVIIKSIHTECVDELLRFELDNKDFFELTCPPRGEDYYEPEKFKKILENLIKEQEAELVLMYLIYDSNNNIIGRINLVDIQEEPIKKAELGYRIGKEHNGKGYATKVIELLLEEAKSKHSIKKVQAGTSSKNIPSQKALESNGFIFVSKEDNYILLNNQWHDNLTFEKYYKFRSICYEIFLCKNIFFKVLKC